MEADLADKIIRKIQVLPTEKQKEVLDFIENLAPKKNIWDRLDELMADVPDHEFDEIPTDAAENLDHYLYGSQKK